MCTPNARLGSCVFLRCVAPCVKPENRHCRGESEGGLPSSRTDGGGGVGRFSLGHRAFAGYCSRPFPHP